MLPMSLATVTRLGLAALLGLGLARSLLGGEERLLDGGWHHLGNDPTTEWSEASVRPEGTRLDLVFQSGPNAAEWVLSIGARSIDETWHVELNGKRLATLKRRSEKVEHYYPVPAESLLVGTNQLSIVPEVPTDDITVGNLRLIESSLREVLDLVAVDVDVHDAESGAGIPARVTVTDTGGAMTEVFYAERFETAVRPGVVYTSGTTCRIEIPAGSYRVWASRGTEWSLGQATLEVLAEAQAPIPLAFALRREVDTSGFVACDTHIHTLTYSGHGDSSVDERMITLAGEGVELAIATDHNHNTDYREWQHSHGLESYFTSVVGNEVTTEVGHFNAFPLDPQDEIPDYHSTDYATLVAGMRAKGAKVVILNHPRWPEHATGPFGVAALDHFTGARANDMPCPFDATELVNSTTEESEPMLLFRDWFALLNRGEGVVAVGSSDSHTVGEPVGQGRTYVMSSTDDPARIDVDEACRHIVDGRSSISMGIFADATVDGAARMGDLAPLSGGGSELQLRVAAPSWVRPLEARVFVNGVERAILPVSAAEGVATDARLVHALDWPHPHDGWLVCVVTGAAVGGPWWPMLNDYTLAATNPIYLDGDGDGKYSSPRAIAEARSRGCTTPDEFVAATRDCDPGVVLHVLDLARLAFLGQARGTLEATASAIGGDERVRAWIASLPVVK